MTTIKIEKVSNGYVITANGGVRAVAKDKKDVGDYFGSMLVAGIDAIKDGQTAKIEINTEIQK